MMIMMMPSSTDFGVLGIYPLGKGEEGILILHSSTKKCRISILLCSRTTEKMKTKIDSLKRDKNHNGGPL
jgi:hypothetical protein